MPTVWYMDYENGTDSNASAGNGDSFATRRKKIDNFVAAAIAPGDTIRIMASPDPTSIGNGTWTDGPLQIAYAFGAGGSASNTSPIVITLSSGAYSGLNPSVNDTVIVASAGGNTAANGVWKISAIDSVNKKVTIVNADGSNSVGNGTSDGTGNIRKFTNAVVTLATACTQNIALCGNRGTKSGWVASTNVTITNPTGEYKEGGESLQLAIGASFTTGKAGYYTLPSTLDLSGYQQVSFWAKLNSGTLGAAGSASIALCSDTTGDTVVNTINLPYFGSNNQWQPVVVDLASALGSSIRSVAFYINTDNGAQTFLLDNIIACKAASSNDSLNLTSLISKNSGSEAWFGIQSINGTRVVLDGTVNTFPTSSPQRGYSGTTETVTTYKRETIKTTAVASNTVVQTVKDSGTSGSLIAFSGGWNRTDMSTQTGETWFDGQNGLGYALEPNSTFTSYDKLNFTRYQHGFSTAGYAASDVTIGSCYAANCSGIPFNGNNLTRLTATTLSAVCCGGAISPGTAAVVQTIARADSTTSGAGVSLGAGSWTGTITQANNNTSHGVTAGTAGYIGAISSASGNGSSGFVSANSCTVGSVVANSNSVYGVLGDTLLGVTILGGSTTGNSSGGVRQQYGRLTLRNFTINEATEVTGFTAYNEGRVYSEKHDGTAGNNRIFCDGGLISTDSGVTHGTASYSWKFSPTSTNRSQYYPLNLQIAQVAVGASALVTVSAWFRRDNTGLTARLICKGGQIAGVTSDVYQDMTAVANTWEQRTITFTPSEAGVVEIEAQFWGGTSYNGWVCDLSIGQA